MARRDVWLASIRSSKRKERERLKAFSTLIATPEDLGEVDEDASSSALVLPAGIRLAVSASEDLTAGELTVHVGAESFTVPALAADTVFRGLFGEKSQEVTIERASGSPECDVTLYLVDPFGRHVVIATAEFAASDAVAPLVSSITPNHATITDDHIGDDEFTLTVVFNENMDQTVTPVLTFPVEDPTDTLTFASGAWSNATTYVATYDVVDVDDVIANIDVRVASAEDLAGNVMAAATTTNVFSIDMPLVAESLAYFAAMDVQPDAARKTIINTLVVALKASGAWTKFDGFHLLAGHDEQATRINLVNPGTHDAAILGSPLFTEDESWRRVITTANGILNTGHIADTPGSKWQLNSAHMSIWALAEYATNNNGWMGFTTAAFVSPENSSNNLQCRINDGTTASIANGGGVGKFTVNRSASNARQFYKNGSAIGNDTAVSTAVPTTGQPMSYLQRNGTTVGAELNADLALGHWGSSLTSTEVADIYTACLAYLQAIGTVP